MSDLISRERIVMSRGLGTDGVVSVPPPQTQTQPVKIRFTVNQTPGSSSSLTPATASGSSTGKPKRGVVGVSGGQRVKHARIGTSDCSTIHRVHVLSPFTDTSLASFIIPSKRHSTQRRLIRIPISVEPILLPKIQWWRMWGEGSMGSVSKPNPNHTPTSTLSKPAQTISPTTAKRPYRG